MYSQKYTTRKKQNKNIYTLGLRAIDTNTYYKWMDTYKSIWIKGFGTSAEEKLHGGKWTGKWGESLKHLMDTMAMAPTTSSVSAPTSWDNFVTLNGLVLGKSEL